MKLHLRFLTFILVIAAFSCSGRAQGKALGSVPATVAPGVPKIEIAFLNHGPVISALAETDKLLASYGDKIAVVRYDLETEQGAQFMKDKKLAGHVPIAIFVNGAMDIKLKDHTVKFYSFPQGKGTFMVASGSWTVDDLRQAIDQALSAAR
jgi:hypothetical protein